jgi:outer membrane receptor protein involved in Fe transport
MFTRNKVEILSAPSGTFTNPYFLPLSNPFLPEAARQQICTAFDIDPVTAGRQTLTPAQCTAAGQVTNVLDPNYREVPVTLARRFVEYGPRFQSVESTQFQIQAGLRGTVFETMNWDISGQYGETNQNQTRENWGSYSRTQQALRAFNRTSCNVTAGDCVPLNLFGPAGSITPEMLRFIDLDGRIRRVVTQTVVNASLSGSFGDAASPLTSTPIGFAVGTEYRKVTARGLPDQPSSIQSEILGTGAPAPADFGRLSVKEAFAELIVPLVEDRPFVQNLTFEGGIRFSDYNTTGSSTTWKAGGSWTPIEDIKIRGMYQRAVRSPNVQELFQSPVTGLSSLATDPCQGALPVGNAALTALCVQTGAPAGTIGSIPTPSANQINATEQGNPNLDVERAKTITLGAAITPRFVEGLSITIDYFNIEVSQAITQPTQGDILNGCYSVAQNPTLTFNPLCALIGRNPINGSLNGAGETKGVILLFSNQGRIKTAGFDIGLNYRLDLANLGLGDDAGALRFSFLGTYLDKYHFRAAPISINRDCTDRYSTNCTNPRPKFKSNLRATYSRGIFDVSLLWRYIDGVEIEPAAPNPRPALEVPQPGGPSPANVFDPYEKIGAYNYFDLAVAANVSENLSLNLTINNLFDKQPPIVGSGAGGTTFNNGNTFPTTYDVLGRTFAISANLKF